MGLPKKALRESQLEFLTAGTAVVDSSHQTFKVSFIESGQRKEAYFKRLEPKNNYPELLGKISVAVSLFKRLFQGKRSAEERLVFDEEDRIVGTLSIGVEGFKPLNYANESVPSESSQKEQVIPSTKTLMEKNVIESLLAMWFLDNDDNHPHNLGLEGDIDFDMYLYWFTIHMKKPRPVIGIPKTWVSLTVRDWEGFPNVKDSKPYHWPTYQYPGQETLPGGIPSQGLKFLPKAYADPSQFERLAHEEKAHEQKFAAALKALLTFQPEMVRKRLTELFGDIPFNYTSLDETDQQLRILYETEFKHLCNEQTNVKSFVDVMMDIYQAHYNNLYRVVVFYMGCENNGYGVSLASTASTLYHKPSFYKEIESWVKKQNATIFSNDNEGCKFDLPELQKRYHQIWRDAHAPALREILHNSYSLTNKLLIQVSSSMPELTEVVGKKATDDSLASAWELIGTMPELTKETVEPLINVDKDSKLRAGLLLLVEFNNKLHAIAKAYYEKERKDLVEDDNLEFSDQLTQLYASYNLKIRQNLAHTSSLASEFNLIAVGLKKFTEQANFQLHLTTTDEQMKDAATVTVVKDALPHTHEDIIKQFNDSLFSWAKSLKPEELTRYITDIIDTKYAPVISGLSKRHRAQPVKDYLLASINESGENRLAYILSSGNEDLGALNTLLIEHLTPHMLQTYPLLSVRNAIREGSFLTDIAVFTKAAVNYAKHDKRFIHPISPEGISLFYQTMYEWLDALPQPRFKGLIESSLKDYEAKLWWATSRRAEVEGYCSSYASQAKAVAMTFLKGSDGSSLNDTLFHKIILAMKTEIGKDGEKQQLPGCKLILQYNPDEHKAIYTESLKFHAAAPSHKQEPLKSTGSVSVTM